MPDNYVSLVVRANDQTTIDFEQLKRRLGDLDGKVATAKVDVNDKAGVARLTAMNARLERLNRKVTPEITLQGALRAEAQIAAVDASLDRLDDKSGGAAFHVNKLVSAFGGLGTTLGTGGLTAAINPITVGLGALAAVMAGPLIASLLPITAGFAAFAAVAVPMIGKVIEARTKLKAAEQAYDDATTKAQRQAALLAEKKATEGLTGAQKGLLGPMDQIASQFHKLTKAVAPQVTRAFGEALKIIRDLMPSLTPLAKAAGKAIDGFLANIDDWLKSESGRKFLKWMRTDGPHAIETFGHVMWDVAQAVGQAFSFLRNAGNAWWKHWDQMIHDAARATDWIREAWVSIGHFLESAWNKISGTTSRGVSRVVSFFRGLPGRILGALGDLGGLLVAQGEALIRGLIAGIEGAIPGLTSIIGGIHSLLGGASAPDNLGGIGGLVAHPPGLGRRSSAMGGVASSGMLGRPFMEPKPYYGPRRVTNQFIPTGWQPERHHVTISNGAELIAVLAALLSQYARTHHGGSAQAAFGYGPR